MVIICETKNELGGSEYFEYIHKFIGGNCPVVKFKDSKLNMLSVLSLIKNQLVKSVHDCSKGGFSVALSEISIHGKIGCVLNLDKMPNYDNIDSERLLFSESHSRYLLLVDKKNIYTVKEYLRKKKTSFGILGKFSGDQIKIKHKSKYITNYSVDVAAKKYFNTLEDLLNHG